MTVTVTAVTTASGRHCRAQPETARLVVQQEEQSMNISSLLLSSLSLLVSTGFSTLGLHPFAY